MIVVDSYAWVEYFLGSEKGAKVEKYIESGEAITPSIILAEIARKYLREGIDEKEVRKRLDFIAAKSTIIEMDVNLSIEAGKAYLELLEKVRAEKLKAPSL
ncbi:MAG: PIN domain-containing protein, partial [Candidatus Aenigmatarchaeota archaeon]